MNERVDWWMEGRMDVNGRVDIYGWILDR